MSSASTFLQKLLAMIEDPKTDHHITWSSDGTSFFVLDSLLFSKEMLLQYFRHNKFASFVRQLNMYDFHKIPIETNGMIFSENAVQFANPYFVRGQPHLQQYMKRKAGARMESPDNSDSENIYIVTTLAKLSRSDQQITGRLNNIDSDTQYLKEEFSVLCQKATQQEKTVSQIMDFLTSIYGPNTESTTQSLSTVQTPPSIQYPTNPSTSCFYTDLAALDSTIGATYSQQQNWV